MGSDELPRRSQPPASFPVQFILLAERALHSYSDISNVRSVIHINVIEYEHFDERSRHLIRFRLVHRRNAR